MTAQAVGAQVLPDLTVSSMSTLGSSSVARGGSVTLNYGVINFSNVVAGSSTSGIYLSTDSTITTSDTLLRTDSVRSISPNYGEWEQIDITIPGTVAAGTYYIGAIADYNNAINESNEANNFLAGLGITVGGPGLPDLKVLAMPTLSSSSVERGKAVSVYYYVGNIGNEHAGASTAGIYLSTDSAITTSDTLLATDNVQSLSPNFGDNKLAIVTIPGTLAAGTYYIGVIADYNSGITESDEVNNASVGVALSVIVPQPDLAVYTPTLSSTMVGTGGSVTLNYTIYNYGYAVAGACATGIYLSTDSAITTSDTLLSTDYVQSLSSSVWYDGRVSITIPGSLAAGTYYIGVIADYNNAISETGEANNFASGVAIAVVSDDYAANYTTTGNLAIGGTVSGTIEFHGDSDYFRVQLVAGTVYEFDLKGTSSGGGTLGNPTLALHDANDSVLRWNDNGGRAYLGSSTDAQIVYIPEESGTYYLGAGGALSTSGSYQLTATTLSPDYYLQAILDQPNVRWNAGAPLGTPVNVTYSFPDTLPSEYAAADVGNYQPFTEAQKAAAREILSTVSTYANITFTEVDGSAGQIRFWTAYEEGVAKAVTLAYPSGDALTLADIALANEDPTNAHPLSGTASYKVLLHEVGHALGLKHPGDYTAVGDAPAPPYLPTSQDGSGFTVETYNDMWDHATTPMLFDVAALQYLYGANLSTQKGDDTYTLSPSASPLYSIWDTAGNDTLSAASWVIGVALDLNPGTVSYAGYTGTATGFPIVSIAFGSTIENAVGGSAKDELLGNAADNTLTGGGGNDWIDGGAGIDVAVYAGNRSNYTLADSGDPVLGFTVKVKTGGEGADNLFDVERLKFANTSVAIDLAGNAGNAAKIIGALFGRQYLHTKEYVGTGLRMFDSGQTMEQVAKFAMGTDLFEQLVGSGSNADFVKLVYENVAGSAPGATDLDKFVHQLDSGAHTQASLAVLAAEDGLNKINIDLVGLAQTGIEYA